MFGMRKWLPQKATVNQLILRLKETGLLKKMILRNEGNKEKPNCKGSGSGPGFKEVGFNHVHGAFTTTIVCYVMAIFIWVSEKIAFRWMK